MFLSFFKNIKKWIKQKSHFSNTAEIYLSKSIDRADFSYREKRLQQKGLL